jgi:hypothetical protein
MFMSSAAAAVYLCPDTRPCESISRYEHAIPGYGEILFKCTVATFTAENSHYVK